MYLNIYDVIFLVIAVIVVFWQLRGISEAKKDMVYEGSVLGRKWTMLAAFAILGFAAARRGLDALAQTWAMFVAVALVLTVYCFTKIGFGQRGVYRNSACYGYDTLKYYELYTQRPEMPIVRVGTDFREVNMVVKPEELDEIVRLLQSKGVKEVTLYRRKMREDAEKMEARRQRREQAKKNGK